MFVNYSFLHLHALYAVKFILFYLIRCVNLTYARVMDNHIYKLKLIL